jgi:hypothetical protein
MQDKLLIPQQYRGHGDMKLGFDNRKARGIKRMNIPPA